VYVIVSTRLTFSFCTSNITINSVPTGTEGLKGAADHQPNFVPLPPWTGDATVWRCSCCTNTAAAIYYIVIYTLLFVIIIFFYLFYTLGALRFKVKKVKIKAGVTIDPERYDHKGVVQTNTK